MTNQRDRVELEGSARTGLPDGLDCGPADPNQQIEVTVLLRRGSKPGEFPSIEQMGARLPRDRSYLSREEFARLHGASAADVEQVRAFAAQYGLRIISEDRASRPVKLSAAVYAFSSAFEADLRHYEHSSGAYRCPGWDACTGLGSPNGATLTAALRGE